MLTVSKGWYWTAVVVGALFLVQYWIRFLALVANGDPWGYENYWGADVGTWLVLAILLIATPAYLFAAWKYWPHRASR
jgi:hypothetical protein